MQLPRSTQPDCQPGHLQQGQEQWALDARMQAACLTSSTTVSSSTLRGRWASARSGARSCRPPFLPPGARLVAGLSVAAAASGATVPAGGAGAPSAGPDATAADARVAAAFGGAGARRTLTPCRLTGSSRWPFSTACHRLPLLPLLPSSLPPSGPRLVDRPTAMRETRTSRTGPCTQQQMAGAFWRRQEPGLGHSCCPHSCCLCSSEFHH